MTTARRVEHRTLWRSFALTLLGVLLMQTAWSLVTPPFRGIDEHEHAFKAAAVALGDWGPSHRTTPSGWGELLTVPTDLAEAAEPVCSKLDYVGDNCVPQPTADPALSEVGSSATRYNPVFYAIVGVPARPFHGVAALYAMRAVASLLCALLLAFAFVTMRRWSRSSWLPATFLLALTPVTLYSTAIPGPNGVELSAAFLLWAALIGVSRLDTGDHDIDPLLTAAAVGAVPLCVVRTLGPLWCVLIVATCLVLVNRRQLFALVRRRRFRTCFVATILLGASGPAWTLVAHTNAVGSRHVVDESAWDHLFGQWVLWFLQSIAAFPSREERAPGALYAIALAALWALVAIAWRQTSRRERLALTLIVAATTVVAVGVTVAAFQSNGYLWQGRYSYPYAAGFLLICGSAVDRRMSSRTTATVALGLAGVVTAAINLIGLLHVLQTQLVESPLAGTSEWPAPSTGLVVVLVVLGVGAYVAASLIGRPVPTTREKAQPALAATHRSNVA